MPPTFLITMPMIKAIPFRIAFTFACFRFSVGRKCQVDTDQSVSKHQTQQDPSDHTCRLGNAASCQHTNRENDSVYQKHNGCQQTYDCIDFSLSHTSPLWKSFTVIPTNVVSFLPEASQRGMFPALPGQLFFRILQQIIPVLFSFPGGPDQRTNIPLQQRLRKECRSTSKHRKYPVYPDLQRSKDRSEEWW